MQFLARQAGLQLDVDGFDSEDDDNPITSEVRTLKAELEAIRLREVEREIDREVNELKSRHGVDDTEIDDLMQFATRRGLTLADAYKLTHFDDQHTALQQALARKAAEKKIADEKAAAGVVHLGETHSAVTDPAPSERGKGLRAAYLAAVKGIKYDA